MKKTAVRLLARIVVPVLIAAILLVAGTQVPLARPIAYYEVTSSAYDQVVGVPFAVTAYAHDSVHDIVTDNSVAVAIASNSPTMVFDSNNNGIYGEGTDSTAVMSYGRLSFYAKDTTAARGVVITVNDSFGSRGSSDAYAISDTAFVSADGWGWQNPLPQGNDLRGISGRSSDDIFAVGTAGTILHYNGKSWIMSPSST